VCVCACVSVRACAGVQACKCMKIQWWWNYKKNINWCCYCCS